MIRQIGAVLCGLVALFWMLVQTIVIRFDSTAPAEESLAAACARLARFGGYEPLAIVGYYIPLIAALMFAGAMVMLASEPRRRPQPLAPRRLTRD